MGLHSYRQAAFQAFLFLSLVTASSSEVSRVSDREMEMDMQSSPSTGAPAAPVSKNEESEGATSYFSYSQHQSVIMAHIALMVIGWCFALPAAVMLSVGRSRFAIPSQLLFLVFNAFGLLFGVIYNNQTPDLYENNAHHKIGWIVTSVISAQVVLGLISTFSGHRDLKRSRMPFDNNSFLPVATDEHEWLNPNEATYDSHSSSEGSLESQPEYSNSRLSTSFFSSQAGENAFNNHELDRSFSFLREWLYIPGLKNFLSKWTPQILTNQVMYVCDMVYDVIDRAILPIGFIAIVTGAVTYGGIFHGEEIFNGLAHFIKGGIFFWYGVLTLGRFIGAWADLGWAWNRKPPECVVGWKARVPSGEFVESFVIWLYGVTNVFLEHLAGWGQAWTASDLQHVSISIMFFGGGLVGMLFESRRIRDAINNNLLQLQSPRLKSEDENWKTPKSQGVPLNPMPALVILLLGIMMGSHHQDSMTSTMVHKQWGNLLVGFAFARAMTYFLLFLSPPTSYLPARPPTEIVSAFCLISGGLIFMMSTRQVVDAMEHYELDAMFSFTVGMGFTAFIMSLVVLAIALKAWAVKRELGK